MNLRDRIARLKAEAGDDPRLSEIVDILQAVEAQSRRAMAEQSRLEERLARVENSAVFRTLRTVGKAGTNTKGRLGQLLLRSPLHPLYAKLTGAGAAATESLRRMDAGRAERNFAPCRTQRAVEKLGLSASGQHPDAGVSSAA